MSKIKRIQKIIRTKKSWLKLSFGDWESWITIYIDPVKGKFSIDTGNGNTCISDDIWYQLSNVAIKDFLATFGTEFYGALRRAIK
jgi:hypothetical protein